MLFDRSLFIVVSLFMLLLKHIQVQGNLDTGIVIDGTLLAVNYNPFTGDPTTTTKAYTEFPVDLSQYDEFSIEFWTFSSGASQINPSMLFYGNATHYILFSLKGTDSLFLELKAGSNIQNISIPYNSITSWTYISISLKPGFCEIRSYYPSITSSVEIAQTNTTFTPNQLSVGKLYLGGIPNESISNAIGTSNYTGGFDELRVWTIYRNLNTVIEDGFSMLSGLESGLLGYWRFDEPNGESVLYDSTPNHLNGNQSLCTRTLQTDQYGSSHGAISCMLLNNTIHTIGATETYNILIGIQPNTTSEIIISASLPPATAQLCEANTSNCLSSFTTHNITVNTIPFWLSFVPSRATCGQVESFSIVGNIVSIFNNVINGTITVSSFQANLSTSPSYRISTEGGQISLEGYFGLDGNLTNSESVIFILDGKEMNCSEGKVVSESSKLNCMVPAGVGANASIQLNLCGHSQNYTSAFSYEAPTISSVTGISFYNISISGTNFGPSRNFDGISDYVKLNGNISCSPYLVNQTKINCFVEQKLQIRTNYTLTISIGGQIATNNFEFVICIPFCEHEGICIGYNECNCTNLPYGGTICNSSVSCNPSCQHGICLSSNAEGSNTYCECEEGWLGIGCSTSAASGSSTFPVSLVAGIVGGVGGALIIVSIVVIVLLAKRRKRGGKNFIPLEKKDFSKIIYGEQLDQSPEKTTADLRKLEALFSEDKFELAVILSNLTQITEADKIAKALVILFEHNGKILQLFEIFIADEVKSSDSSGTLFRSNSMVSKMFKFYSRLIGLPYLYVTVGPELCELVEHELGLEVDPEKMVEGSDLDEMRWTLMAETQKILKSIINSIDKCPVQFRTLFAYVKECVEARYPGSVNVTIGGFYFLRFFCPAISSPEAYGILEEPPSASTRRLLILITKVLQSLSNDIEFGSKEPYMTKLNDFIHSNRAKLASFFEKLTKPGTKAPTPCVLPRNMKEVSLALLANFLKENIGKIDNPSMKAKLEPILG